MSCCPPSIVPEFSDNSTSGVQTVSAGTNIIITGTATDPVINSVGGAVQTVNAGSNITITGTATNPIINASPSTTVNNSSGSVIINSYDHIKVDTQVTPNNTTVSIYSIGYLTVGGTYSVSSPWVFVIDLSTLFQIITLDTSYAVNISIIGRNGGLPPSGAPSYVTAGFAEKNLSLNQVRVYFFEYVNDIKQLPQLQSIQFDVSLVFNPTSYRPRTLVPVTFAFPEFTLTPSVNNITSGAPTLTIWQNLAPFLPANYKRINNVGGCSATFNLRGVFTFPSGPGAGSSTLRIGAYGETTLSTNSLELVMPSIPPSRAFGINDPFIISRNGFVLDETAGGIGGNLNFGYVYTTNNPTPEIVQTVGIVLNLSITYLIPA